MRSTAPYPGLRARKRVDSSVGLADQSLADCDMGILPISETSLVCRFTNVGHELADFFLQGTAT